jgi:hypothetical protein
MRGPRRSILEEDEGVGLTLYVEGRQAPGGEAHLIWTLEIKPSRNLPRHLVPADQANISAARQAFPEVVAWLKAQPTSHSDGGGALGS